MNTQWFYDPKRDWDDNFDNGPFFDTIPELVRKGEPQYSFLGHKIYSPFGIASGTLPTSRHMAAAFQWGYDVNHYKSQRSGEFPVNKFPNMIPIEASGDITLEQAEQGFTMADDFPDDVTQIAATNSFGIPSRDPSYWQEDMKKAVASAGKGQLMIASALGTIKPGFSPADYWQDFANTAKLMADTGVSIVEVNLSCPNIATEGVICYTPEASIEICRRSKEAIGNTDLLVKLGYYSDSQQGLLESIIAEISPYVSGISVINTIAAKVYDKHGNQALPGEGRLKSGLVGAPIKWAGLDMVRRLAALRDKHGYNYEIVGVGGVVKPADFFEYREAGADLVQACTGPLWNPNLAHEIAQQLAIE